MKILLMPFKLLWSLTVILIPLIGVWVASSLAAFHNGPTWAVVTAGALLFPVLPLLWEWRAYNKYLAKQKDPENPKPRILTFWDRMILRTLLLNLVFLGGLLAWFPSEGFTAISTRGDWMLQSQQTKEAKLVRKVLFTSAQGLEWLYELSQNNPYDVDDEGKDKPLPKPPPKPAPKPTPEPDTTKKPDSKQKPNPIKKPDTPKPSKTQLWPMSNTIHPVVRQIPASAETSVESVAKYIGQRVTDPVQRVKALHDYVADRIAYDAESLARGIYPSYDPEVVLKRRKGVCAGYAKLLVALGKHTGDDIRYVTGKSRDLGGNVGGAGHAWNAAKIKGNWYLIDATWNAGSVNGTTFKKSYGTDYLFTPPEVFGMDHFPKKQEWQLRHNPITRGEFMRQPVLKPRFFANGLKLLSPKRSQITVGKSVTIELDNPRNYQVIASLMIKGTRKRVGRCDTTGERTKRITCRIPSSGTYQVYMFSKKARSGSYPFVGQIEVNSRGF